MEMIKVINHNEETLKGRFDGEDFEFPCGKAVHLPLEAAKHIFGLGAEDKSQALNMLGWLVPGRHTLPDALKKLDKVSFLEGRTVYEDEEGFPAEEGEEVPEQARSRRVRTGGRPHVAGPGGESGVAGQPAASANPV
jgi:hypothetical protein